MATEPGIPPQPIQADHLYPSGETKTGEQPSAVVPLRAVEPLVSDDTLATVQHILELVEAGECTGIAFAAILRGGRYGFGYAGAGEDEPELAAGIVMTRLLPALTRRAQQRR